MSEKQKTNAKKKVKQSTEKKKTKNKHLVTDKTGGKTSDKCTNYSQTFLEHKFCSNKSGSIGFNIHSSSNQQEHSVQPTMTDTERSTPPPSSPRDVNEISLHISLLDDCRNTEAGQVCYVYRVKEI